MLQPLDVHRSRGRHKGSHTCCVSEKARAGETETTRREGGRTFGGRGGGIEAEINNFTIEMAGTEEEAAEGLYAALGMEVE